MGINTDFKLLVISFFAFFIISCKGNKKNDNGHSDDTSIVKKELKDQFSKTDQIDFIKSFYTKYLRDLNEHTNTCVFREYLSEELINVLNKLDYNAIIDAQDYGKFDLNTLKVLKTKKIDIYRVSFINMNKEVLTDVKIVSRGNSYIITELTNDQYTIPTDFNKNNSINEDEFTYYLFKYRTKPDDPMDALKYRIEYIDNDIVVINMDSRNDSFEYECLQKKSQKRVELHYKKNTGINEFTGDRSKPLMKIYKKGDDFYATSPLIEDGKEIKLKEEE
ncbi:conserved hypothetical protein [Tenacibaculum maritimum]|uniref:hypothetical protein n=1 Tax=Tenacibaculum maritimum TaxID=107401 RepID=UPI0012E42ACB|nr:hypothetical protein [Tenacibaculum maritimum]CAA0231726.1 conserved hypothetical protein [Tenacibaculum maritimum]